MNNDRKVLKSGAWYTFSNFLIRGVGFFTTPIFTRILSKTDFGLFNNYTSWLSIITIFATLNLESTLISARFDFEDDFDRYIFSMLGLSSISTIIWTLLILIFQNDIADFTSIDPAYLIVMMVFLLFSPAVSMFVTRERYLFKYKGSVIVSIVISISTAVISVLLVSNFDNRLFGRILGAAIPTVLLGVVFYLYFFYKGKKIKLDYWKYAMPICLPYIPHLLAGTLLNSMDRVMIERYCGAEATAIYSLAYTCGAMVTLFISSLNSAFAPWMGEKIHLNQTKEINYFSKIYITVFMTVAIGVMLIAPDMLYVLGGEPYIEARFVITPVAMGCVCQFLYTLYVNVEQFNKKTIGMAVATMIAAAINYMLNYILIPKIGYLAAAYTTLSGFLALLAMHIFLVYRMGMGRVYNIKYVILAVLTGIVSMIGITCSYNHLFVRTILIIIYLILCVLFAIKNKNKLGHMISLRKK